MQLVKWTGWTLDYIYNNFTIDELNKLIIWAYNQEKQQARNIYSVVSWFAGIQHRKTYSKAQKNLKKALEPIPFSGSGPSASQDWLKFLAALNPQLFDKMMSEIHNGQ